MRLIVQKDWQYRDRARGMRTLAAGEYLVPDQVDSRIADLCVSQGMGRLVDVEPASVDLEPVSEGYVAQPLSKRARRRRKGRAPENKLLHVPENKRALV